MTLSHLTCERCQTTFPAEWVCYINAATGLVMCVPCGNVTNELYRRKVEAAMSDRFDYVAYDEEGQKLQAIFKEKVLLLEDNIAENLEDGRAKSLALTKLEEVYMWIGKAVRDEQIKRNGSAPLQEGRNNG